MIPKTERPFGVLVDTRLPVSRKSLRKMIGAFVASYESAQQAQREYQAGQYALRDEMLARVAPPFPPKPLHDSVDFNILHRNAYASEVSE